MMFPIFKDGYFYYFQFGIFSFGIGKLEVQFFNNNKFFFLKDCKNATVPGVYVNIPKFTDWIKTITEST